LPQHHLRDNSKDTVKVVPGMIATLSALVLGLLVASAKSSLNDEHCDRTKRRENYPADRVLAGYGPETKDVREQLGRAVSVGIETFWPEEKTPGREWQTSKRRMQWRKFRKSYAT
jgi:hypothetical protein